MSSQAKDKSPILGLRTVVYHVPDIDRAKAFYSAVLGVEPYFDQPFYVGFNVGGYELGLDPDPEAGGSPGPGGTGAYWGVADAAESHARLLELGAKEHGGVRDVGEGIRVAEVKLLPFRVSRGWRTVPGRTGWLGAAEMAIDDPRFFPSIHKEDDLFPSLDLFFRIAVAIRASLMHTWLASLRPTSKLSMRIRR